jgi:hypothetical protein
VFVGDWQVLDVGAVSGVVKATGAAAPGLLQAQANNPRAARDIRKVRR